MGDLGRRLAEALERGAGTAPPPIRLADGARARARVRRRRRVVGGVVAAVAAVAVPMGVVAGGPDAPRPPAVVDADAGSGWKTVAIEVTTRDDEVARVLVDVPASWGSLAGCPWSTVAEPGATCQEGAGVQVVADLGSLDHYFGPGLRARADYPSEMRDGRAWGGYVGVGGTKVSASADDEQVALRVLGSARLDGTEVPDLATPWPLAARDGVAWWAPEDAGVEVRVSARDGADARSAGAAGSDADVWLAAATVGDWVVSATAPTQALAEVVAGSAYDPVARAEAADWTTLDVGDLSIDVPVGWRAASCGDSPVLLPPDGSCRSGSPRVLTYDERLTRWAGPALGDGVGSVLSGATIVDVDGLPRDDVRRILASVRPRGSDVPDLSRWETEVLTPGVTADVPVGAGVDLVLGGFPSCAVTVSPATRVAGGWRAGHCRDRVVTVTAPTEALATVVALTVRD